MRASLASARFDLSGSRARLKLRVRAREYVAVGSLIRGGKRVVRRRTKGYAPGRRTLAFPIGRGLAGKRIAVKLTLEDGQGNVKALTRKQAVPRFERSRRPLRKVRGFPVESVAMDDH
ncbi:MAG: hypothetical protein K0S15_1567 [Solirubrobacterales bacterium]|nr:hypothetical protein [Solirubrobacterales bacterium]